MNMCVKTHHIPKNLLMLTGSRGAGEVENGRNGAFCSPQEDEPTRAFEEQVCA